jgi:hypothetical protein
VFEALSYECRLVDLQTLELQSNDITSLSRALEHCTSLTYVDLSDNRLEGPVFADLWVLLVYEALRLLVYEALRPRLRRPLGIRLLLYEALSY